MEKISQKQNVCGDICVKPELRRIVSAGGRSNRYGRKISIYPKEVLKEHGYEPQEMTIAVVSNDFHLLVSVLANALRIGNNRCGCTDSIARFGNQLLYS